MGAPFTARGVNFASEMGMHLAKGAPADVGGGARGGTLGIYFWGCSYNPNFKNYNPNSQNYNPNFSKQSPGQID